MLRWTMENYAKAFSRAFTYNVRKNHYLWFGFLWGIPVPAVCLALDHSLGTGGRTPLTIILEHPIHLFFLGHPLLFALVFGAMGTVRRELEEQNSRLIQSLTDLATTDALTGLHNRRYGLAELEKALQRSRRTGQTFSLVLFDLDGFKQVNDTRGHTAGDEVLKRAAGSLRRICREGDVLSRYGGDEFLLLAFGNPIDEESLPARADQAVLADAGLGTSSGIAHFPQDGKSAEELIPCADARLAEAKARRYARNGTPRRGAAAQKSTALGE